jgi:glycosyltransferase involved in cell wall biosynthesis
MPLAHETLRRWHGLPHVRLHLTARAATQAEIRAVYAAADASLLCRHPGVGKESGLVADAVRFGVPLIASAHDSRLTTLLEGPDWARTFPAGNPNALASILDALASVPLPRPGADAAQHVGVPTADAQAAFLARLPHRPARRSR